MGEWAQGGPATRKRPGPWPNLCERSDMPKGIPGSAPRCAVEGCARGHQAYGWCNVHYLRWKRHGDPCGGGPSPMLGTLEQRFWAKADRREPDECWPWTGTTAQGYGFVMHEGLRHYVHRWSYEHHVGPIPDGLTLDHLCRNRACVNPAHLEPVTIAENVMRGESPPARNARKTHCPQGHPYDATNTSVSKTTGWRQCRTCARERERSKRRAAQKGDLA